MANKISFQGKNIWIALVLSSVVCGLHGLGHIYLGQKMKGIILTVLGLVMYGIGLGWVVWILAAIDIWSMKDLIESGAEVDETHHGLDFFSKLPLPGFKQEG